jgi:hypothetical protein
MINTDSGPDSESRVVPGSEEEEGTTEQDKVTMEHNDIKRKKL